MLALYIGGMGARGRNFYNDLAIRYGFEKDASRIQDLYLTGEKAGAVAAVPDALVDEVSLIGPIERVKERLSVWEDSGVTGLAVGSFDLATLRGLAEAVL
jgi:hypothetical protein